MTDKDDDALRCPMCNEDTYANSPHANGCPYGDGFTDWTDADARAAAWRRLGELAKRRTGLWSHEDLGRYTIVHLNDELIVGGTWHASADAGVLARTGPDGASVLSMVTGESLAIPLDFIATGRGVAAVRSLIHDGLIKQA